MRACEGKGSVEVVEILISNGADIYSITRVRILYIYMSCGVYIRHIISYNSLLCSIVMYRLERLLLCMLVRLVLRSR